MTIIGTTWAPRGPSPIAEGTLEHNGMVTAIAVHPGDANIVYVGTAGGGVWKTFNGLSSKVSESTTWRPLFDRQLAIGIGEPTGIALDPNDADIVYVGTS